MAPVGKRMQVIDVFDHLTLRENGRQNLRGRFIVIHKKRDVVSDFAACSTCAVCDKTELVASW